MNSMTNVVFNPPQTFIRIQTIHSMIIDDDGNIDSVNSKDKTDFYLLTEDIKLLLRGRKRDFESW